MDTPMKIDEPHHTPVSSQPRKLDLTTNSNYEGSSFGVNVQQQRPRDDTFASGLVSDFGGFTRMESNNTGQNPDFTRNQGDFHVQTRSSMLSASGGRSLNPPSNFSNKFQSVRDLNDYDKGSSEGMIEEEIKEEIQM